MHTSVAVFIALTVIYAGTLVLPADLSAKTLQFTGAAASTSCAVATFFVLKASNLGVGAVALVLVAATAMVSMTALAMATCSTSGCRQYQTMYVSNSLLFSSSITTGTAAYLGYLVASLVGLPVWAAIVVSVLLVPMYIVYGMPVIMHGVANLTEMRE